MRPSLPNGASLAQLIEGAQMPERWPSLHSFAAVRGGV